MASIISSAKKSPCLHQGWSEIRKRRSFTNRWRDESFTNIENLPHILNPFNSDTGYRVNNRQVIGCIRKANLLVGPNFSRASLNFSSALLNIFCAPRIAAEAIILDTNLPSLVYCPPHGHIKEHPLWTCRCQELSFHRYEKSLVAPRLKDQAQTPTYLGTCLHTRKGVW